MKALFLGKNHSQGLKETDSSSLTGAAKALSWVIVESLSDSPDLVICVDYQKSDLVTIRLARKMGIPTCLIINEPKVVVPEHGQQSRLDEFDRILKIGRVDSLPVLNWPQTWRELTPRGERLNSVVIVNADKWSFIEGQLYWLRAAAARHIVPLDIFGHGWNRSVWIRMAHRAFEMIRTLHLGHLPNVTGIRYVLSKPKSFMGQMNDKIAEMSKYKVALVIENSQELITEKLFDAWFAGCIPVYVGPQLAPFGIPESLVVRAEPNLLSVRSSAALALQMDHTSYIEKLREFLEAPHALEWNAPKALEKILRESTKASIAK